MCVNLKLSSEELCMITPELKTPSLSYLSKKFLPDCISLINNMLLIPYCIPMYLWILFQNLAFIFFSQNFGQNGHQILHLIIQNMSECQHGRGMEEICVGNLELSLTLPINQHTVMTENRQSHVLISFDFHCKSAQFICSPYQFNNITQSMQTARRWGTNEKTGLQR